MTTYKRGDRVYDRVTYSDGIVVVTSREQARVQWDEDSELGIMFAQHNRECWRSHSSLAQTQEAMPTRDLSDAQRETRRKGLLARINWCQSEHARMFAAVVEARAELELLK